MGKNPVDSKGRKPGQRRENSGSFWKGGSGLGCCGTAPPAQGARACPRFGVALWTRRWLVPPVPCQRRPEEPEGPQCLQLLHGAGAVGVNRALQPGLDALALQQAFRFPSPAPPRSTLK